MTDEPKQDMIQVPPQVQYGICIFQTTDPLAEPVLHIHAPGEFASISLGMLARLVWSAMQNINAELIWAKFADKAKKKQTGIIVP